jgi:hypothetical protein
MTDHALTQKFREQAGAVMSAQIVESLAAAIWALSPESDIAAVGCLL